MSPARTRRVGGVLARFGPAFLAMPGVAFLVLFFVVPVCIILAQSFLHPGFTLRYYSQIFDNQEYLIVLAISIKIALVATLVTAVASYPVAYLLLIAKPLVRALMFTCILLPFWTNILIRCYAWMLILQTTGLVNTMLVDWLHILTSPLSLVFNFTGVIIGMVHYLVPIDILILYSTMKGINLRLLEAAKGLGASPPRAFVEVFVPLSMGGVRASLMLVFVISLGFFVTPALLGGRTETTIAMLVSTYFSEVLDWSFGSALAVVLLILTIGGLCITIAMQRGDTKMVLR